MRANNNYQIILRIQRYTLSIQRKMKGMHVIANKRDSSELKEAATFSGQKKGKPKYIVSRKNSKENAGEIMNSNTLKVEMHFKAQKLAL